MLTVDAIGKVRRAHFVQGKKIKAIAREMNLARNTVRDIIRAEAKTEHRDVRKDLPRPAAGRSRGRAGDDAGSQHQGVAARAIDLSSDARGVAGRR